MDLKAKLENGIATISVLGLGYVGLPLAVEFAKVGFPVVGIDVDEDRLHKIKTGALVSSDVDDHKRYPLCPTLSLSRQALTLCAFTDFSVPRPRGRAQ
jgi:UDP-N-acetyl-D-mannosaminuronate dehydrogenase